MIMIKSNARLAVEFQRILVCNYQCVGVQSSKFSTVKCRENEISFKRKSTEKVTYFYMKLLICYKHTGKVVHLH